MKRRAVRATIITLIVGFMEYIGSTQGGGEGFFPDPNQAPVGYDVSASVVLWVIVWVISFLPWLNWYRALRKKTN